jgi:hypothetical protein
MTRPAATISAGNAYTNLLEAKAQRPRLRSDVVQRKEWHDMPRELTPKELEHVTNEIMAGAGASQLSETRFPEKLIRGRCEK